MWFLADEHRRHLALTVLVGAGLAAYLLGSVESVYGFDLAMLLALAGGLPIFIGAVTDLARRRISADLAVALAAVAALVIGQYAVAAEVVLIMLIGEALENFAVGRTRSGIARLLALRPETARVRRNGQERVVPVGDIRPDDVVLVRPGDRIPVDGKVLSGGSTVDQSPITGESLPADKGPGDEVFAGTINLHGALELSVDRLGADTALERIVRLVEEAEETKAPTQRLADRYALFFVPIVLAVAGATYLATRDVVRSVAVLVVACPCALVLATPTAIASGIGSLVRRGVLVKGGAALESLGRLGAVIFDKTGTLTRAKLRISRVVPAPEQAEADVLRLAAAVDRQSEHPIGRLIAERAAEAGLDMPAASAFAAHPGLGASAEVDGRTVRVGSPRFLQASGVAVAPDLADQAARLGREGCTVVLVSAGARAVGAVAVEDTLRPEARRTVDALTGLGVRHIALLTGDNPAAAAAVGAALGIQDVRSALLPSDKVEAVREIQRTAGPVAMVGDGINDAPSLATADVGVTMAEIGTDVAIASADVVLVGEDLSRLLDAVTTGRRVLRTVWQNILGFALCFNAAAVFVASMGWISPVTAAVLHQVSSLVVCLNSLRLLAEPRAGRARLRTGWNALRSRWRTAAAALAVLAALAYALSGVHIVRIGQAGVAQRFGKAVLPVEAPGLHVRLPWPFGAHAVFPVEQVRRVETGYRTIPGAYVEAPAYEWNLQHRGGRYERRADEADVWAGDENLVDVNLTVHYQVADPQAALFRLGQAMADGTDKWDALVRAAAEAALRAEMSARTIEEVLSEGRAGVEQAIERRLAGMLESYGLALSVRAVRLADVHPPLEVVPNFRDVVSAMEEKEASINQAQAYQYRTEALARGQAVGQRLAAEAFGEERTRRADGRAKRFSAVAGAYAASPTITSLRLYLEMVEETLAGKRKVILDRAAQGARRMVFLGRSGLLNLMPPPGGGEAIPPEKGTEQP